MRYLFWWQIYIEETKINKVTVFAQDLLKLNVQNRETVEKKS